MQHNTTAATLTSMWRTSPTLLSALIMSVMDPATRTIDRARATAVVAQMERLYPEHATSLRTILKIPAE